MQNVLEKLRNKVVIGRGRDKKKSTISFIAKDKYFFEVFDKPVPASKLIPEWYKKESSMLFEGTLGITSDGNPARTVKACMPVFDMISAGYMLTLPGDLNIEKHPDGTPNVQWSTDIMELFTHHAPEQYSKLTIPEEYFQVAFKFMNPWIIKTKPGYSCMFIQPSMRDDLPFQIVPGIVDTDKHPVAVNFPFFLRKDFQGMLEMGTPIVQVIPFKREDWESDYSYYTDNTPEIEWQKSKRKLMNRYKTFYRTPKIWK